MKYMGSKRFLLNNGLGDLISSQLDSAKRFVDPFCGSGAVVKYVAGRYEGVIIASDLQEYAVVLSKAIIGRTKKLDADRLERSWLQVSQKHLVKSRLYKKALRLEQRYFDDMPCWVRESRLLCSLPSRIGPVWKAYGGHYYSPRQAITFDYLIRYLPENKIDRNVCLAASIMAATRCAAAPGHTAQPFQATETASTFIKAAWKLDVIQACKKAMQEIAPLHAKIKGLVTTDNAVDVVAKLKKGDLVLIDPPYSGVQYSRFYHVLETIARGHCGEVSGVGRYPDILERPQSAFSNVSQSEKALDDLLHALSRRKATVIVTFPKGECSNGLSGDKVIQISKKWFTVAPSSRIHEHVVTGKFSTLGGNNKLNKNNRLKKSRVKSQELLLLLIPKVPAKT